MIEITIPGDPQAQGRPRFARRGGFVQTYDPPESKKYKELVKLHAAKHKPKELLNEALIVEIDIFKKPPQSISKVKKNRLELENESLRPLTKPDLDNYAKGIKDALTGVIWTDDSKVVELMVRKFYSLNPRAEVRIKTLEENK